MNIIVLIVRQSNLLLETGLADWKRHSWSCKKKKTVLKPGEHLPSVQKNLEFKQAGRNAQKESSSFTDPIQDVFYLWQRRVIKQETTLNKPVLQWGSS